MNIPINENAPVKSRNQMEINAPIEIVWNTLTDINNWPKWQKSVTEVKLNGRTEAGSSFEWKSDGLSFKSKIHTSKPHTEFGWTGTTIGASAIHNWTFVEKDTNTTIVIIEESLQGVLPKLFSGYFQKKLDSGVLKNLIELKDASEKKLK